jgi:hypothetical protein
MRLLRPPAACHHREERSARHPRPCSPASCRRHEMRLGVRGLQSTEGRYDARGLAGLHAGESALVVGFRPTGKPRKRLGPKRRAPSAKAKSAKAKSATGKALEPRQQPAPEGATAGAPKRGRPKLWIRRKAPVSPPQSEPPPAQAASPPPEGAAARAPKRGRPKVWIRRRAPAPSPQPEPPPAPIEVKPAPKPAKRKRIWIRRKARASMAAQERSEA